MGSGGQPVVGAGARLATQCDTEETRPGK